MSCAVCTTPTHPVTTGHSFNPLTANVSRSYWHCRVCNATWTLRHWYSKPAEITDVVVGCDSKCQAARALEFVIDQHAAYVTAKR